MYKVLYIGEHNKTEYKYFEEELKALIFFTEKMNETTKQANLFLRADVPKLQRAAWGTVIDKAML